MSDLLTRTFAMGDVVIREDGGDGRTVTGIVVPFNVPTRVKDPGTPVYEESFQRGAFAKTISERKAPVPLLSQHDRNQPIGVARLLEERDGGLYGEFRVSSTRHGNDQLELARDGALGGFSIGFVPVMPRGFGGRGGASVVRSEVKLREVSLVTFPAYEDATISGVRSLIENLDEIETLDDDELTSLAARLDAAVAARASATSTEAGTGGPLTHPGRITVARNQLRAALIERGIV